MSRLTNETVSLGNEDRIEDPVSAIEGMLHKISEHVKDLSEKNDLLKRELSQPDQNQACSSNLEEKGHSNNGKQDAVSENAQYHIALSEDCQKIIKELKFQRNNLSRIEFVKELADNHLHQLSMKFDKACDEFDSYLRTGCQNWYEATEAEGEWFKLLNAKKELKEITNYALKKKDEDAGPGPVTLKNKTNNPETLTILKPLFQTKGQCNLCSHLSSFGMTHTSKVHAKKPHTGPLTESCPWIVGMPMEGKNRFLHAYENFCKLCLKFHIKGERPCNFTLIHPGLKCRVDDCQERWILCENHHDKNKHKLNQFKHFCAEAGIDANIELTY